MINVINHRNGGIKARLGEWDAQVTTEPNPYVDIAVSKITLHPQYNSQNLQNDIAVLKLNSAAPISTSPNINTACLPSATPAAGTRYICINNIQIIRCIYSRYSKEL